MNTLKVTESACPHVRKHELPPATTVTHTAAPGSNTDLATLTTLCPICSAVLVRTLQELEADD